MGKRSDFERVKKDFYRTIDPKATEVFGKFHKLEDEKYTYYEPCVGSGDLVSGLNGWGFVCSGYSDIETGKDAFTLTKDDIGDVDYIITNPPWTRNTLHPMIEHFRELGYYTWLLFDADWAHTKQATPYLKYCSHILSVGRLKWIPDTKMTGKDNCAWYLFSPNEVEFTEFINGRMV